jgi:glycerophosphoryl diester phosphodiesterase
LLLSNGKGWESAARVTEWKGIVQGLGPNKTILERTPQLVEWAHAAGMTVVPYTFRSSAPGRFASVKEEMDHFLYSIGVDGLFTDNPDLFPRR